MREVCQAEGGDRATFYGSRPSRETCSLLMVPANGKFYFTLLLYFRKNSVLALAGTAKNHLCKCQWGFLPEDTVRSSLGGRWAQGTPKSPSPIPALAPTLRKALSWQPSVRG